MTRERAKRPKLERTKPIRGWSTLFAPPGAIGQDVPAPGTADAGRPGLDDEATSSGPDRRESGVGRALSDAVDTGYRVFDDYLKRSQQVAQGFGTGGVGDATRPPGAAPPAEDIQQMAQRVMQYGWDFAGLWFEMLSRMGGQQGAWPVPPAPWGKPEEPDKPPATVDTDAVATPRAVPRESDGRSRLAVSVVSARPATTTLDLRPSDSGQFEVQTLRPAKGDGPPISTVGIAQEHPDAPVVVTVEISDEQPAGIYNALIVDATTNLPLGTLSVQIVGAR